MRLNLVKYAIDKHALQHSTAQHSTAQHSTAQHSTAQHRLLDFGCGKGKQLAQLKNIYPRIEFFGYEPYLTSDRIDSSIHVYNNLHDLVGNKFDFVIALDVIEHIEDDLQALRKMHSLLIEHGVVLIHVPAYMHLWSTLDTLGGHFRRYTKHSLMSVVQQAGFTVKEVFYVTPFAYPAYLLRKYVYQVLEFCGSNYDENTFTDNVPIDPLKIPSMLVALELTLIKKTILRSPFGSSIFLHATKTV